MLATYLLGRQNANGSWDYNGRPHGDTSISQYAILGLWEAENAGIDIPPSAWDRAAGWFLSVQDSAGGWNYHRDEPARYTDTVAMTAAGVGSLLICQRQLDRFRHGPGSDRHQLPAEPALDRGDPAGFSPVDLFGPDQPCGAERSGLDLGELRTGKPQYRRPIVDLYALRRRANRGPGRPADDRPARLVRERADLPALDPAGRRLVEAASEYRRDEYGLGDPLPDQVHGQDDPENPDQAAGRGHAPGGPGSAQGPDVDDGGRRASREPSDERRHRGDARRPGGSPRRAGRCRRRRAGRALPPARAPACSGRSRTGFARC